MPDSLPTTNRAVVLSEYHEKSADAIAALKIAERPIPPLRRGQVLVRIEAAPCNPSDLLLLQGKYGTLKALPTVPGWEGAGTIIASGGGFLANWLRGRRVACALRAGDRDGTWAEYFVADANSCIPLKARLDIEQAASLIINPITATGLLDQARRDGHRAAISTAAASQLGRMLIALAADANYPLINVVRRDAQVKLLTSLGSKHVLDSSRDEFGTELKAACEQLHATAVFEAIAGDATGQILNAMPPNSTAYLYGALSEQPCGSLDPVELIFHKKSLRGFYLGDWLEQAGILRTIRAANRVQQLLIDGRLETTIQRRLSLDEMVDGLKQYVDHMTDGKVLLTPHKGRTP